MTHLFGRTMDGQEEEAAKDVVVYGCQIDPLAVDRGGKKMRCKGGNGGRGGWWIKEGEGGI